VFGVAAAAGIAGLAGVLTVVALASGLIGTDSSGARGGGNDADARAAAPGEDLAGGELPRRYERVRWRDSEALGTYSAGSLRRGVRLPQEGKVHFSWDPVKKQAPNRSWRMWGTDRLVRMTLRVLRDFARENPGAPRVGVGDLSRPQGGDFGPQFGKLGHVSHQNGLDIDVYYPRIDGEERRAAKPSKVDLAYAQDLVDRFVEAGAAKLFVGPSLGLSGPTGIVSPLVNHDDHIHVRLPIKPSPPEEAGPPERGGGVAAAVRASA